MSDFDDRWSFADVDTTQHFIDNMYYTAKASRHGNAADVSWMGTGANSGSAAYLAKKRNDGVSLSKDGLNKLSQTRQSYMVEMAERARLEVGGRPDLGLAATVSPRANLVKTASLAAAPAGRLASTENTTHLGPEIYSPLFLTQNLQLPRDRITANAWNRAFYETNPIVRNAINLHATYPISKLNIKCEDKNVEKFFNDMAEKIDLQTVVQNVALEYWALGEAFPYAALDEATGMWDQIYIHNPDYIRVKASPIPTKAPIISLKPDPELQKLVTSSDPEHIRLREQIDPKIINHVIRGEMIPLDSFSISHLKYLKSPYDVRGTSIINGVWKMLMAMDKIFENKFVQLDGMINPLTLVHLGAAGSDGHYPRQDEVDAWRSILEVAQFDKDFKIVTHDAVKIEKVGNSGAIVDTGNDLNMIIDLILMGLMIPKSVLTQEGSSYASASVALDVMRQRYNNFRVMMASWLEKKIFAPISEINQFYKLEAKKKRLIVPTIEWNHMTLYDLDNYIAQVSGLVEKGRVSQQTLDRSLGLNRHNEVVNIREEMIQQAIAAKEAEALSHMTLAQLRALDPEEEIITHEGPPLPGAKVPGMGGAGFDVGMGAGGPGLGGDMFGGGLGGGLGGGMGGGFGPPMPGADLGIPGGMGPAGPDLGAAPGAGQPPTPPPL